jgi:hypothetical protein
MELGRSTGIRSSIYLALQQGFSAFFRPMMSFSLKRLACFRVLLITLFPGHYIPGIRREWVKPRSDSELEFLCILLHLLRLRRSGMLRSISVSCGMGGCVTDSQEVVYFLAVCHSFASMFTLHTCGSGIAGRYCNRRDIVSRALVIEFAETFVVCTAVNRCHGL